MYQVVYVIVFFYALSTNLLNMGCIQLLLLSKISVKKNKNSQNGNVAKLPISKWVENLRKRIHLLLAQRITAAVHVTWRQCSLVYFKLQLWAPNAQVRHGECCSLVYYTRKSRTFALFVAMFVYAIA